LDKKNENGDSPLHLAARSGEPTSVKPLIDSDVKLNARNKLGNFLHQLNFYQPRTNKEK
jgi:hypothetical protein